MKTFLHVGCGPKRKDRTTAGFSDWNDLDALSDDCKAKSTSIHLYPEF